MEAASPLIFIAVLMAMFYFLAIRPQKRRQMEMQKLQQGLKAGDEIVTLSGIYGTVTEVEDGGTLLIEVSEDTEIRIASASVGQVVNAQPAPATTATAAE